MTAFQEEISTDEPRSASPGPRFLYLLLYLVNLFLIHPAFLLTLDEINPFDEASYINSGRMLLEGNLPSFAGNPLVDVFYALTYLPFWNSAFWLVQSAVLGRLLLFSLLWVSVYLVARQLARWAPPVLMVGLLLVTPLAVDMLRFPSDPLFAGLAGLSLWQLLRYREILENPGAGSEEQRTLPLQPGAISCWPRLSWGWPRWPGTTGWSCLPSSSSWSCSSTCAGPAGGQPCSPAAGPISPPGRGLCAGLWPGDRGFLAGDCRTDLSQL